MTILFYILVCLMSLFYILVCLMSLFFLFGKLTATRAFIKFVMFVLCRLGGLFVLLYAVYQLAKIWGYTS